MVIDFMFNNIIYCLITIPIFIIFLITLVVFCGLMLTIYIDDGTNFKNIYKLSQNELVE
jgi:hypothetical protein